jgi:hypothetical protein
MDISNIFRIVIEIGFGCLYLIGAIFNALYTWRHGEEFYGSFADKATLSSARQLIRRLVIPWARLFTSLLIAFQLLVAVSILSQDRLVEIGLLSGAIFCLGVVFVSNMPGAIANLIMSIIQLLLVVAR